MKTSYTNPHAVTDIGGTTGYVYDNLGNMTVAGGWLYTPDYRNRLTIAVLDEEITHTYPYHHQNPKTKKKRRSKTTAIPPTTPTSTTTSLPYLLPHLRLLPSRPLPNMYSQMTERFLPPLTATVLQLPRTTFTPII